MDPGPVSFLEADFVVIYKNAIIFIKCDSDNKYLYTRTSGATILQFCHKNSKIFNRIRINDISKYSYRYIPTDRVRNQKTSTCTLK
jgi:hypothetical protein